ncbi:rhodanese-like domain-containing protein [Nocardioides sediminis]|uniref:rhodanese-like domain-containing protein n=1 Tax=Nocardioides sediminis TaxID=433648 RepID=UPI000D3270F1|nr:rhodanese-like domain-containing protein [Nocardioides sediminis]
MPNQSVQSIGVPEVQSLIQEANTLVLDVRTPGEFETAHIDGAVNIPVDQLDPHLREIVHNAGGTMVLVCQSGGRAEQAADKLSKEGKDDLVLLEGGMNAWQQAGAPVRRGEVQRWALERQVRLVAGSIVLASVGASAFFPRTKWLGAGVGGGLVFAAVSNSCMMASLLSKLPYNRGAACDIDQALTRLGAR